MIRFLHLVVREAEEKELELGKGVHGKTSKSDSLCLKSLVKQIAKEGNLCSE
jgi:hypothetical protein